MKTTQNYPVTVHKIVFTTIIFYLSLPISLHANNDYSYYLKEYFTIMAILGYIGINATLIALIKNFKFNESTKNTIMSISTILVTVFYFIDYQDFIDKEKKKIRDNKESTIIFKAWDKEYQYGPIEVPIIVNPKEEKDKLLLLPFKMTVNERKVEAKFKINNRKSTNKLIKQYNKKFKMDENDEYFILSQGSHDIYLPLTGNDLLANDSKFEILIELMDRGRPDSYITSIDFKNNGWEPNFKFEKHFIANDEDTINITVGIKTLTQTIKTKNFIIHAKLINNDGHVIELPFNGTTIILQKGETYTSRSFPIEIEENSYYKLELGISSEFAYFKNRDIKNFGYNEENALRWKENFFLYSYNIGRGKKVKEKEKPSKNNINVAVLDASKNLRKKLSLPIYYMLKNQFNTKKPIVWNNPKYSKNYLYIKEENLRQHAVNIDLFIPNELIWFDKIHTYKETESDRLKSFIKVYPEIDIIVILGN